MLTVSIADAQGRSQKFVWGYISFFFGGGIKLLNSCSDVIVHLPYHKKFTWADFGGINTDIHPVATPLPTPAISGV